MSVHATFWPADGSALDNAGDAGNQARSGRGTLKTLHVVNDSAAECWIHIYDALNADVTPGTTTPDLTIPIGADWAGDIVLGYHHVTGCVICGSDAADGSGSAVTTLYVLARF